MDVRETREWYLPRHKSSSIELEVITYDTPFKIRYRQTKKYSHHVLINGLSLVVFIADQRGVETIIIGGSAGLKNHYKIAALFNGKIYAAHCKGNVELYRLPLWYPSTVKVMVTFDKLAGI